MYRRFKNIAEFEVTSSYAYVNILGAGLFVGPCQRLKQSPFLEAFKDEGSYTIRIGNRELVIDRKAVTTRAMV